MRASMTNTVDPLVSLEEPPAVNYAAVRSFPLFPSLTRGPFLSAVAAEAGAQRGPRRVGPRLRVSRGPPFLGLARVGLSVVSYFILFIYFTDLCNILKNM